MIYDVAVIGAGVIGCLIARTLSRYNINICLLDQAEDVAMGSSKANSAIIHAGYDAEPGSLKARLNVRGNQMMEQVAKELNIPFKRIGSFVLAFSEKDNDVIQRLCNQGIKNGVDVSILNRDHVKEMEPHVSDDVIGALYAPSAGIICPYELTIAAAENAVENGVDLKLGNKVLDIHINQDTFELITQNETIQCTYIVNAAGIYADHIAQMIGDNGFSIRPRKGEYVLLDKRQGSMAQHILFQPPSKMGKGVLVTPTIDGNLLIGPNAYDVQHKEDTSNTISGMNEVIRLALKSVPSINLKDIITAFSGLRAVPSTNDFIICESKQVQRFIHAAGIESPGLSAAPAIAEYVLEMLQSLGLQLQHREDYSPYRKPVFHFRTAQDMERRSKIKQDPMYGKIICRCEMVTEGEIVECIHRGAGARNVDAVKRRTRAGMGRCQGGFCTPRVAELLSRELAIPMDEVTKMGGSSRILAKRTKQNNE